jgi:Domain of unknown function (DUF4382)
MHKHKAYINLGIILLLIVSLSGCGSSNSSGSQQGILGVSLTDASVSGFDAVYITVSKVRVHQSASASDADPGWSEITLNPARKINLLDLTNGILEDLGQTPLPAGHYTQLRLVLLPNTGASIANSVVLSNTTTEIQLKTPSAVQSGIKLIHEFDVAPGQRVDLVLDFDALKSIVQLGSGNGGYLLKPVIKVVPTVLTGIDGFVDTSLLSDNVMVSSQVSGTVIRSTIPNAQTGEFFISHLAPGNYDLVITADGHATAVVAGVPVSTATNTAIVTMVSTSNAPISLPTSTMQKISGTVSLSTGPSPTTVASVVTKQTFSDGPTVTVKSQNVSPLPNVYSLALPSAAPLLGQYGTGTLPIVLTPQSEIAGKYAVEASADGFQTQSANVDISIADVIQNFKLPMTP